MSFRSTASEVPGQRRVQCRRAWSCTRKVLGCDQFEPLSSPIRERRRLPTSSGNAGERIPGDLLCQTELLARCEMWLARGALRLRWTVIQITAGVCPIAPKQCGARLLGAGPWRMARLRRLSATRRVPCQSSAWGVCSPAQCSPQPHPRDLAHRLSPSIPGTMLMRPEAARGWCVRMRNRNAHQVPTKQSLGRATRHRRSLTT